MAQKYRIYINDKVILLTETEPKHSERYQKIDAETFDLRIIYTWILAHKNDRFFVLCDDAKAYLKQVIKNITLIEAAGGLVKNQNKQYLFIFRQGRWDIPKGKIEKNESIKETAVRETEEECGISISELGKKVCKTYHAYTSRGEVVLKKTHWFKMRTEDKSKLKPQKEEGITDARWLKKNELDVIVANTFPSILEVLHTMDLATNTAAPLAE